MNFEDLTPELQEKAMACATTEEMLALAKEEGYELSSAELEQISGGGFWDVGTDLNPENGPCATWK